MSPSGIMVPVIPPLEGSFEGGVGAKHVLGCRLTGTPVQRGRLAQDLRECGMEQEWEPT